MIVRARLKPYILIETLDKNGIYFITTVIQNREYLLGKIENNEMILSDFGKIAKNEWYKSFEIRHHVETHGRSHVETHGRASLRSKQFKQSKQPEQTANQSQLYCKPKLLWSFIAGYKSAVTTQIKNNLI